MTRYEYSWHDRDGRQMLGKGKWDSPIDVMAELWGKDLAAKLTKFPSGSYYVERLNADGSSLYLEMWTA